MKKILSLFITVLSFITVFSQTYNMTTDSVVYNCLAGGGKLYDSGGPGADYGQNEVSVLTICPDVDAIGIELVLANFGSNGDFLCVYDGPTASSPLLACYTTSNLPPVGSTIRATTNNPNGCLTFQFTSDGITTGGNFEFNIECLPACQIVEAEILATDPDFVVGDTVYINSCPDDTLLFFGNGIYDPIQGYAQSNATSQFYWDFGDGTRDTTQNPVHIFPQGQIFSINLVVEDVAGCQSRTEIDIRVRQAPYKELNFNPDPILVCLEDTVDITAFIDFIQIGDSTFLDTITGQSAASIIDTVFLPDDSDGISGNGITTPVIYPLDIFGYIPGTTLTDINDIYEVCLEMEHSFVGDLDILVVCPNGQSTTLVDFSPPGTPGNSLGIPGSATVPGTPFEYCWSPTSALGSIDVGQPSLLNDPITAGTYQAAGNWNDLLGCPFNGEWSVQIFDDYGGDDGWTFSGGISLNPIYLLEPDTFLIYYQNPVWDINPKILSILNDTVATFYASDTTTETLYFNVENNMGCDFRDSVEVEVSYFEIEALPEDTTLCEDTIQLSASILGDISTDCDLATGPCGATTSVTVGTQSNTGESPYDGFWEDSRIQLLYTAAELNALGFNAGNINSLAFNITGKNSSAPFSNYTIKMQCTSLTALTTTFVTTGFSTVFGPVAYNSVAGWNQHNFGLPYTWDGVSNLLVEVCFDNNDWTSEDPVSCSPTAFNSVTKAETDGASGCSLAGETTTTSRPNIRLTYCGSQGSFVWTPNISISDTTVNMPSVWPANSTQYIVSSTNSYNCTFSDTVDITVLSGNFQYDITNDTTACLGESVQLNVTDFGTNATYTWTPNTNINDNSIFNPIVSPGVSRYYYVTVDLGNCSFMDSVFVEVLSFNTVTIQPADTAACANEVINLTANTGLTNYEWVLPNGSSSAGQNIAVTEPGYYYFTFDGTNTCRGRSDSVLVSYVSYPTAVINNGINPVEKCLEDSVLLFSDVTPTFNYQWQGNPQNGSSYLVFDPGTYILDVSTLGDVTCTSTFSVDVVNTQAPVIDLFGLENILCCGADTIPFDPIAFLNLSSTDSVFWNGIYTSSAIEITSPGTNTIEVVNQGGCNSNGTYDVEQYCSNPVIVVPADTLEINQNGDMDVTTTSNPGTVTFYEWTPTNLFDVDDIQSPDFSSDIFGDNPINVIVGTTYTFGNGTEKLCFEEAIESIFITDAGSLEMPTAFSPNGDGLNDTYGPVITGNIIVRSFAIYNRWGDAVYQFSESNQAWDGTYEAQDQPSDVYVYYISVELPDGIIQTYSGSVTLFY